MPEEIKAKNVRPGDILIDHEGDPLEVSTVGSGFGSGTILIGWKDKGRRLKPSWSCVRASSTLYKVDKSWLEKNDA
jgi:hypothetical protein